jgi:hypothetical protein
MDEFVDCLLREHNVFHLDLAPLPKRHALEVAGTLTARVSELEADDDDDDDEDPAAIAAAAAAAAAAAEKSRSGVKHGGEQGRERGRCVVHMCAAVI